MHTLRCNRSTKKETAVFGVLCSSHRDLPTMHRSRPHHARHAVCIDLAETRKRVRERSIFERAALLRSRLTRSHAGATTAVSEHQREFPQDLVVVVFRVGSRLIRRRNYSKPRPRPDRWQPAFTKREHGNDVLKEK